MKLQCTVNDKVVTAEVEARMLLCDFLRHDLHLTGTHVGCEMGVCGACTVVIDGEPQRSCLVFAAQLEGAHIRTVEALSSGGCLGRLQQAFHEHHALQCGFCTAGVLMTLDALQARGALPTTAADARDVLSGHICRCTGYQAMVDAVLDVAR